MKDMFFSQDINSSVSASRFKLSAVAQWMQPDSLVRLSFATLIYAISAWGGVQLGQSSAGADVFWPANGILLAILLRLERRYWVSYLAGSTVANILAHSFFEFSLFQLLTFTAANTSEVLVAALLLSNSEARRPDLNQMRTLGRFVLFGVLCGPLVSTGLVQLVQTLRGTPSNLQGLTNWFAADALGIAIMTPLVLAIDRTELATLFGTAKRMKTLGILAGLAVLSCAVFAQSGLPVAFLMIPALLLAIFRLGSSGSAIGIFLMAVPAAYFTAHARGPFSLVRSDMLIHSIFLLQCFLFVALIILYSVSSALSERDRLQKETSAAFTEADANAARDHITSLANRRTFDKKLTYEWQRAIHEKGALSLLMIDVDQFKLYNDYYGHVAGDECLRRVAAILAGAPLRSTDMVARYGGEEFAIVLPRALTPGAAAMAERIRQSVGDACLPHMPHHAGIVTISIGVATLNPADGPDETLLIRRADHALYAAKNAGRNQVAVWSEPVSPQAVD
jgi:diguanylate cyclase (GGDEF)-like protein